MSDGKVVYLDVYTTLDILPERVLTAAIEANLSGVVVLGYDQNGEEYMAASTANPAKILWLMERLKKMLLERADK